MTRFSCPICEQQIHVAIEDAAGGIVPMRLEVRCQGRPLEGPDSAQDHGPMQPVP